MLINLSNHPSPRWSKEQKHAAASYGDIIDIDFPSIDPAADSDTIAALAQQYLDTISRDTISSQVQQNPHQHAIHVMGEMTFTCAFVMLAQARGLTCLASTSSRNVVESNGEKHVRFQFIRFREYPSFTP